VRWIWKLYPRSLRERFGTEMVRDLERREAEGRPAGVGAVVDALVVLVRAWLHAGARRVRRGGTASDVIFALRALRRAPGYAFGVVAILALALGANTAVFSVTHAVLLKALPYGSPERVYAVWPSPLDVQDDVWVVDEEFEALPHVEAAAVYVDGGGANLGLGDATDRVALAQVTEGFFDVLEVPALLGRTFAAGESDVTVLSYDLWVRAFGADPGVLGRRIDLNGRGFMVVGVMPDEVEFPSAVDLWLPFPTDFEFYSNAIGPSGIALLRPNADPVELRTILEERRAQRYAEAEEPSGLERPPVEVTPLREELTGSVETPLQLLMVIAGLVVFLGCLNLAGLVMSRTARRMGALSIRRALGASRTRIFSQLIAEVLILSALAGVVGLGAARLTLDLLAGMLPAATPGLDDVGLGAPVLLFAGVLTVAAGCLVGAIPSLQGALASGRLHSARTATETVGQIRTQAVLVVGQVAVAAVLVVGASLLGRSLRNLEAVPLGYDLEHVLTFRVQLPSSAYPDGEARRAYLTNLMEGVRQIPGVSAVGASSLLPLQDAMAIGFRLVPDGMRPDDVPFAVWVQASTGYFQAMGMDVARGAADWDSGTDRWGRVVITESLARTLFPESDPIGAQAEVILSREESRGTTVAAVVRDVRIRGRQGDPTRVMFTPVEPSVPTALGFAVRAGGSPSALVDRIRQVVLSVDPSVPPYDVTTTRQTAAREIATERAVAFLSRLFSASALVLAALGLYGLVAQGLIRRRRELGIRLVMGAEPRALVRTALRRPVGLALVGLTVGLLVALWAGTSLTPLLFGVTPNDPTTLALVALAVLAVTVMAAYLPARRIVGIDPTESLRTE
jgi:putative ABC transport system permease protein